MPEFTGTALGFDVGHKRTGVAIGQSITRNASPLTIIEDNQIFWDKIKALLKQYQPTALVIGLPLDVNDQKMSSAVVVEAFKEALEKISQAPIYWINERYSTKLAKAFCQENGIKRNNQQLDDIAATIILQTWIDQSS